QAEDGIRDFHVTGVQTCALPILIGNGDAHLKNLSLLPDPGGHGLDLAPHYDLLSTAVYRAPDWANAELIIPMGTARTFGSVRRRSEERRVGQACTGQRAQFLP